MRMARQHRCGGRPLQREKRTVLEKFRRHAGAEMALQMGKILLFAGGVDDEEQIVRAAQHHEIVADAAPVVGE